MDQKGYSKRSLDRRRTIPGQPGTPDTNVWELGITPILVPTWSLTFEWIFYFLFPLIILLPGKRCGLAQIAGFAALFLSLLAPNGPQWMRFLMFFTGAGLASMRSDILERFAKNVPDFAVIMIYTAANLIFVRSQNFYVFEPVYAVTCSMLVVKCVFGKGVLNVLFSARPLRFLGNISYSFYLLHGILLIAVVDYVRPFVGFMGTSASAGVLLVISLVATILSSYLFYLCFERPYFLLRRGPGAVAPSPLRADKLRAASALNYQPK